MKIKTSDLTGAALDWAVATCEGYTNLRIGVFSQVLVIDPPRKEYGAIELSDLDYCGDWAQGGPIIEREFIDLASDEFLCIASSNQAWHASTTMEGELIEMFGPTPLLAAMRCYAASKLGDEADVPEELLS